MQTGFQCSYCGQWNVTDVDESGGLLQEYVEDCQVCCQPNVLTARLLCRDGRARLQVRRES